MRRLIPFVVSMVLLSATAQAGLFDDEEARKQVAETKRRVEEVNRQLDARIVELESTIKSQGLLDLFTQIEALKSDIAKLRGQIEVLSNEMESTQKRQRDLYVDLDTRMRKAETAQQQAAAAAAAAAAATAAATAAAAAAVGVPVPGTVLPPPAGAAGPATGAPEAAAAQPGPMVPGVSPTGPAAVAPGLAARPAGLAAEITAEQRTYDAALDQFKSGNYGASLQSFVNFVRTYPRSPLAPSAQYWVGNAHYALKDYRSAIASQRQLIGMYPDSQKIPDALLNISSSQIELADTAGARRTLDELVQRYPASEAADRAKKRLTGAR